MKPEQEISPLDGIAIIGMALRFPGASVADQFWKNLCDGVESITTFSDDQLLAAGEDPTLLASPSYVKSSGIIDGIEQFDADFFGFTPREAEATDPQHRIFLECAWEALEISGHDPDQYVGRIGVFAGAGLHCYYQHHLEANPRALKLLGDLQRFISVEKDFISTRVSYRLNLKGPSLTIQTACSTSLVAVHLACQSLLNGESDMALAGGVSVKLPQISGYLYQEGSILSPDGHCRAFDAAAHGTVFGSGAGIVVLKRLADAIGDHDSIHAVILGSAINNDGAMKVGYTAPSVDGQATVISDAHAVAGISAEDVTYIETHGTGTSMGDPIEVAALTKAFRATTDKNGFCAIGSLKTNVGHLDAAAGVAGLIKTVLALEKHALPPSLNYSTPNPTIDFANSPFYVQSNLTEWKPASDRRIAGVSSFGIGGTNAHVVVQEPPVRKKEDLSQSWQLLTLSARTPAALDAITVRLGEYLAAHKTISLTDAAYTLQEGRHAFPHRRVLAAKSLDDAIAALSTRNSRRMPSGQALGADPSVVFMFPAQGAQHPNMGRDLYEAEPVFRENVDRCARILEPKLKLDLRTLLYPDDKDAEWSAEQLRQTRFTQPAVFTVNYALAQLWMAWGISPAAMVGHSLGEYVAATLAGVFELEDALLLVAERARLMQELPPGSMLSVQISEQDVTPWLGGDMSLAAVNAPGLTAVSGTQAAIEQISKTFEAQGIGFQLLRTSHAFHSAMMEPMIAPFVEIVSQARPRPPRIPFVSTLTGQWITPEEATDPAYWGRQTRFGVRFSPAVLELLKTPGRIFLEVGPGNTLTTLAGLHLTRETQAIAVNSLRNPKETRSDEDNLLTALGRLWIAGVEISWNRIRRHELSARIPLPTYPFERKKYWIDAPKATQPVDVSAPGGPIEPVAQEPLKSTPALPAKSAAAASLTPIEAILTPIWQEILGVNDIAVNDNFFDLGGQSLMGVALVNEVGRVFSQRFSLQSLLDAPTIAKFAHFIETQNSSAEAKWSSMDLDAIAQNIRKFVEDAYLSGKSDGLRDEDSLLQKGIVDENNLLHLVAFLEDTYGFAIDDDEMTSENLGSIRQIAAYVLRRGVAQHEPAHA